MNVESKLDSQGNEIFTVTPPYNKKLKHPIGWFKTEEQAIDAYNNAIKP